MATTSPTPYVQDVDFTLWNGDARQVLSTLEAQSVDCAVTSPPYWGLRDYGVSGQLGLEATPEEYVEGMVDLFGEVRRVLVDDGTLWLNLGDSYAANGKGGRDTEMRSRGKSVPRGSSRWGGGNNHVAGLKPKDLIGVPWRVAFALQEDGWYLRSDIVWSKPNPMPESVTDRPTKSHEYVFLLSTSSRYYYDAAAIADRATWFGPNGKPKAGPHSGQMHGRVGKQAAAAAAAAAAGNDASARRYDGFNERWKAERPQMRRAMELAEQHGLTEAHFEAIRAVGISDTGKALTTTLGAGRSDPEKQRLADEAKVALGGYYREFLIPLTRNARTVWEIQTMQYADAHFAVFPEELAARCILAGCPEGGTVLDPFMGSGTTALVARRHGRKSVGIELNADYCAMAARRLGQQSLLAEPAA